MKTIWRVTVVLEVEEPEDKNVVVLSGGYDVFNVEARDDIEARKRGIHLMKQAHNEFIKVKYVETEHLVEYHELPA